MAAEEKWYFTREQLANTPSRKSGYDADKELSCRQQAANFIQDMGQRLLVTQLCINTAIVYMHRFYMFHSFTRFHRNAMAAAALFLAAKVEEQPRKLEHVIKVAQICLHREQPPPDVKSEVYIEQAQELVVNENILLQTLGFDVAIDHPHTHVVRCCHLVRASKDLAQTSYFMASNSLHLTTMCLQYKPTVVACFCIHLACKWSNWEIPQSTEGKPWFWYVDKSVTQELLEQLTEEFLAIFEKCPSRLKKKITSLSSTQNPAILSAFSNEGDKKRNGEGSSSNSTTTTGPSFSGNDDMKKKQEYLRHHPDYKKHHIPHHARSEGHNMTKSSCMFGPPTRTLPSSHGSSTNSNASGTGSSTVLRTVPTSKPSALDPVSVLGKPDHLHHRPRRPDEKHPRNHELMSSQYKKYDKVSSGVISDFMPTNVGSNNSNNNINNNNNNSNSNNSSCSNRVNVGANNTSYKNVPLSHVQSSSSVYLHQQQQQQLQPQSQVSSHAPVVTHQQGQSVEVLGRIGVVESSSNSTVGQPSHVLSSLSKHQLLAPQPSPAIAATLSHPSVTNSRVKSPILLPPHSKVERSIFSPEKSTPPSEGTKHACSSSQSPSTSSVVTVTPHIDTNTTTTTQPVSIASISSTVHRKKNEAASDTINHSKVDEAQKTNVQNQYHSTHGDSVKSEATPKEEKPSDVRHNEGNISHPTEALAGQPIVNIPVTSINLPEESHTKEQKKKKKKHKEHKEKHKDKHKHKHKNRETEPIVITIPKEKLSLPQTQQGLKIKIAKDKIGPSISAAPSGLKIKIPKEKIKESRKRERSEERAPGLPGKFHRPNGTTLQVNKALDIMECSDSENDRPNLSLEINSPPIALNDACPSFDEILRPGTPPGMSDVLLELIQPEISNSGNSLNAVPSEVKEAPCPQINASVPLGSIKTETKIHLNEILNDSNVELEIGKGMLNENNVQNKTTYQSRQNGGYSRGSRYSGGRRRGRGYHAAARIAPPPPPPPPQPAYMGGNNWEVMRHGPAVGLGGPLPPPGYMLGPPPTMHPSHFFAPTMIVPNFPPPPPLPDDPPPLQPPPPPPE